MTTDQTSSILWLWVLQVAWWLAYMLPLALAVIAIVLGFRRLNRRARAIEAEPVAPGPGGFLKIIRDKSSHVAISRFMLYLILGGMALGGMLALFLQSFIQPEVERAVEQGDLLKPEAADSVQSGASLDLILFLSLVVGVLTFVFVIYTYRSLCRRAAEMVSQRADQSPRPLLVRWFHDRKRIGVLAMVIGGWLFFGLLMQVVGLMVIIIPVPEFLTNLSFRWTATVLICLLAVGMALLLFALYAPAVWMALRHFKLEVRYYEENEIFRTLVNVVTVFGAGAFGALLTMHLLTYLGTVFWPSIFH